MFGMSIIAAFTRSLLGSERYNFPICFRKFIPFFNNAIKVVRFEASEDGTNWESIGQFGFTNQDAALKYYVKSSTARYIKLVIPDGVGNGTVAAIRELDVRGTVVN